MSDQQGVREIQLNGKQLVFLFMTTTVAAVVIFLCGVMVGRGVAPVRATTLAATDDATSDPTAAIERPASAGDANDSDAPASTQQDLKELSYAGRLEAPEPPPEPTVEPVAAATRQAEARDERPATAAVASAERPTPEPKSASTEPKVDRASADTKTDQRATTEPKGEGFVVQVASLRSRGEADAIAQRLSSKGFPSFVTTPASNGPPVFRVRVGKYANRGEAENIARRLEKEEQFKPWITR